MNGLMYGLMSDQESGDMCIKADCMASAIKGKLDAAVWQQDLSSVPTGIYSDGSGGAERVLQHVQGFSNHIEKMALRSIVDSAPSRAGTSGQQEPCLESPILQSCSAMALSKNILELSGPSLGQTMVRQFENIAAYLEHKPMLTENPQFKTLKREAVRVLEENDHVNELMRPNMQVVDGSVKLPALKKTTERQTHTTPKQFDELYQQSTPRASVRRATADAQRRDMLPSFTRVGNASTCANSRSTARRNTKKDRGCAVEYSLKTAAGRPGSGVSNEFRC